MEFRGAPNLEVEWLRLAPGEFRGVLLQVLEEGPVPDQGHLHGLGDAGDLVSRLQGLDQGTVVDDREGRAESAQEVLFPEQIDPVLDPHSGIALGEYGAGDPDDADSPVADGGRKSRGIQNRTPSHDHHEGLAIQAQPVHRLHQGQDMAEIRLDGLAPDHLQGLADQFQFLRTGFGVGCNPGVQLRMSTGDVLIDHKK